MKVYCAPNTISVATIVLLEETSIPYEPIIISLAKGDQTTPEYHAINPKGRVPAVVTDDGILTETGAIMEYLAALAPTLGLVPTNVWQAGQMRSVMYYLAATMHVNHAHKMRGHRWADNDASYKDMTAKVPETMAQSCAFIEDSCQLSPFVMGADMSVADPWLFTICTWLEGDGVDITAYPKLSAHFDMMNARASVTKARDMGLIG
ncbi:glutathione S-transferase family protein [Roseovarius sp. 2305UL8-3]|uniref:glutathione S-transferase family protein n=1 Tax=Roseovarius conchicola TaxID=3121636 RepID=UPI003527358A